MDEKYEDDIQEEYENDEARLTSWNNEPEVSDLMVDIENALSHHHSQIADIEESIRNLNGELKHTPPANRSKVVMKLIRKQAEWRYSSLEAPFLAASDMLKASPTSADDNNLAEQTEVLINNQLCVQMDSVKFYNKYVRKLVNQGAAILKVGWEYKEELRQVSNPVYAQNPMTQDDMVMEDGTKMQVGMEQSEELNVLVDKATVKVLDFASVITDPTCKDSIEDAAFVAEVYKSSISKLQADGSYSNLHLIDLTGATLFTLDDSIDSFEFADDARKEIEVVEYWGNWDIHGDNTVEPILAVFVGNTMIKLELNPFPDQEHPYINIQYLPDEDRILGETDGSLIKDDQDILSALTRGMIDIMARSANGQQGVAENSLSPTNYLKYQNNEDFMFKPNTDPYKAFWTGKYPEIPQSALMLSERAQNNADAMTGIQSFGQGMNGASLGETARSVTEATDSAAKRELGILNRMTAGIKKVARKFNSMNASFLSPEQVTRVTGKEYVPFDKSDMSGKLDIKFSISTPEENNAKIEKFSFVLQTLGDSVSEQKKNLLLGKIARLSNMPELAGMIETEEPPAPDPMAIKREELELQKIEVEIQKERQLVKESINKMALDDAKTQKLLADISKVSSEVNKIDSERDIIDQDFLDKKDKVVKKDKK